ncbi:hypothetical protein SNEBB_005729 [Seison nebaliae]|nr:hypothetical protein SNEBB_005729 [Seison nebaliae]
MSSVHHKIDYGTGEWQTYLPRINEDIPESFLLELSCRVRIDYLLLTTNNRKSSSTTTTTTTTTITSTRSKTRNAALAEEIQIFKKLRDLIRKQSEYLDLVEVVHDKFKIPTLVIHNVVTRCVLQTLYQLTQNKSTISLDPLAVDDLK